MATPPPAPILHLRTGDVERLRQLAEAAYPHEFCAILVGCRTAAARAVQLVFPVRNCHPDPRRAYSISPDELIRAQKDARERGLEILGFVHSHPDHSAQPSQSDAEQAFWPDCIYGIVSVYEGVSRELRFYRCAAPGDRFELVTETTSPEP